MVGITTDDLRETRTLCGKVSRIVWQLAASDGQPEQNHSLSAFSICTARGTSAQLAVSRGRTTAARSWSAGKVAVEHPAAASLHCTRHNDRRGPFGQDRSTHKSQTVNKEGRVSSTCQLYRAPAMTCLLETEPDLPYISMVEWEAAWKRVSARKSACKA